MRVLVLHSELGVLRGGGENFTRNLFPAFVARGHRVSAAFAADWRKKYPLPLPDNIDPIPMPGLWSNDLGQTTLSSIGPYLLWKSRFRPLWDRGQQALAWRAFAWHKRRFQRRVIKMFAHCWQDFDAVYVHGDVLLAGEVARHRPTVLRLPGPVSEESATLLRSVHAVCANGDALIRTRAFLGDHAIELPVGLDTRAFAPGESSVRSALKWTAQDRVVGYVGRLTHLKGLDLLAKAFCEVARTTQNARLLMVGGGEQERHIRTVLASEFGRGDVHIEHGVGHDELPRWYRAMDVLVMPSRYENHSNALLEALACGTPFLASDIGGNRALSDQTGAGWLFEAGSIPSLTRSLLDLVGNPAELKARGEMGARCVGRHPTWAASAEKLESIISSRLLAPTGAGVHVNGRDNAALLSGPHGAIRWTS